MPSTRLHAAFAAFTLIFLASAGGARADSIEDFYKGKTVTFYIGFSAGNGAYDVYGRFLAKYLGQHLPGNPNVVINNMPGAGTRTAANYVAHIAPQDGTAIGIIDQALPLSQALGEQLPFDTLRLNWIGNMIEVPNIVETWTASGVTSIDDAKKVDVPLGAAGSGSSQQAKLLNLLVGTRFKIIQGYPGSSEIELAMQQGEIWARTADWAGTKAAHQDWLSEKKISVLVQIGLKPSPDLPNVPLMMNLASNDDDRTLLKLASTSASIGKPIMAGPGVPPERVAALRAAFSATLGDPAVIEDAKKNHLELLPMSGQELSAIIADINATPKPLRDKLASLLGGIWD
jgi:tripartite-type tricarboxylate transporter receptor subunit TctC